MNKIESVPTVKPRAFARYFLLFAAVFWVSRSELLLLRSAANCTPPQGRSGSLPAGEPKMCQFKMMAAKDGRAEGT